MKNSGDIIPEVMNLVQYSVEEACSAYDECDIYTPFTDAGKAVFHVEHPKGYGVVDTAAVSSSAMTLICTCIADWNYSPIVKNNIPARLTPSVSTVTCPSSVMRASESTIWTTLPELARSRDISSNQV